MNQEIYHLIWNSFLSHLDCKFRNLVKERHFADVTLVSDDQIQIPAHKIVLSASSPVLKKLLLDNPHPHPMIFLNGVKHELSQNTPIEDIFVFSDYNFPMSREEL